MQRFYRVVPICVMSVFFALCLIFQANAVSLTPGEDGVPEAAREQVIQVAENPVKILEPQDGEISLFYITSVLWQGMNVACGDGDYIYGYPYLGLQIVDISNPSTPEVIAEYHHPADAEDMVLDGNYLYVAAGYNKGLLIFDVSDPHAPVLASSITVADANSLDGNGVEVVGNTVYLSCGREFVIADVSNPYSPQVTHVVDPQGLAFDAAIMDNYAYIASEFWLELWDLSGDPSPVNLGWKEYGEDTYDVVTSGNLLYVADRWNGLFVINAAFHSLPLSPLGFWQDTTSAYPEVEAVGDYAYLRSSGSVKIIDASTPTAPVLATDLVTKGSARSLYVSGSELYMADWRSGVDRYDVSSPAAPVLDAEFISPGTGYDLAISGDYGFEANGYKGLQVLDLSQPESPNVVSSYDTPGQAWAVASTGNTVYLSDDTAGVIVFDVSNPLVPVYVETIEVPHTVHDIAIAGDYAYFACGDTLLIFDISNSLSPVRAAGIYTGPSAFFAIDGNYAYVSVDLMGLQIVDITDPTSPQPAGFYSINGYNFDVGIVGSYAYLATGYNRTIDIIDVSDPENPTLAGQYQLQGGATDIAWVRNMQLVGDYLYLAAYIGGFQVLNVSDPLSPYLAGAYNTSPLWAWDVDVVGDYVYVTCDNGFLVLRQTGCTGPDGASGFNIADAVYLIHYIFSGGPAPDPIQAGDVNCDGAVNLGDAVYLIDFIFRGGSPPCGGCY